MTDVQALYNEQAGNAVDVTSNDEIPAPAVERWLADNAPRGVNTRRNTIYLINWYERSDFRFHVYTKTNEPDPDTGYNFGAERASRKITAWGGAGGGARGVLPHPPGGGAGRRRRGGDRGPGAYRDCRGPGGAFGARRPGGRHAGEGPAERPLRRPQRLRLNRPTARSDAVMQ